MRMARLAALGPQVFDLIVIGGGIAGTGVLRDAAMRGYAAVLFEQRDLASGTSSRSSKLIHGGLRYLELLDVGLVRESLRERAILGRLAPHLVHPLPFLLPVYRGDRRGLLTIRVGLALYDLLRTDRSGGRYRTLAAEETLRRLPGLDPDQLRGAGYYADSLLDSAERLCLENVLSARRFGARAFTYARVEGFVREAAALRGVEVRDLETGAVARVRGRVVVNAGGPWVDEVRHLPAGSDGPKALLRRTKGIHLLVPRLAEQALYAAARRDARMFFVIPWREFSLVGTTDTDFDGDLFRLAATREEVAYLLAETRRLFPRRGLAEADIVYAYAGVRPLAHAEGKPASAVSREHRLVPEGQGGTLLSIVGTKLTTYRSMAAEVVDRVGRLLGRPAPCRTHVVPLEGGVPDGDLEAFVAATVPEAARRTGLPRETVAHVARAYGAPAREVLAPVEADPRLGERVCPRNPDIAAQVRFAVEREMARHLADVMLRRTGLGTSRCLGRDCCERVAQIMGAALGWDAERLAREVAAYLDEIALGQRFRGGFPDAAPPAGPSPAA
jgi:glycerol-3-phosphate dehydrogenase